MALQPEPPTFFSAGCPSFSRALAGQSLARLFLHVSCPPPTRFTYHPPSILEKDIGRSTQPIYALNMVVYSFYIFDRHSASQSISPLQCQSLTTLKPSASIPGDGLRDLYSRAVKVRGRSPAPALPAIATMFPQPAKLCRKKTMPS